MSRIPIVFLVIALCVSCAITTQTPLPATPTVPAELVNLPQPAKIICHNDANLDRGTYVIWELPGVAPSDKNSSYQGDTGKQLGEVKPCAAIIALDFSWSETDQEYWVQIKTGAIVGWVKMRYVSFTER